MNKTSYLLPHSFQRIGWGLLIACPVLLVLNLWIFNGLKLIPQSYSQFGILVLYITAALSALFVGLSEEKQEDEFSDPRAVIDDRLILTDEIEATHIGCEYGEYDHDGPYHKGAEE